MDPNTAALALLDDAVQLLADDGHYDLAATVEAVFQALEIRIRKPILRAV